MSVCASVFHVLARCWLVYRPAAALHGAFCHVLGTTWLSGRGGGRALGLGCEPLTSGGAWRWHAAWGAPGANT